MVPYTNEQMLAVARRGALNEAATRRREGELGPLESLRVFRLRLEAEVMVIKRDHYRDERAAVRQQVEKILASGGGPEPHHNED